MIGVPPSELGEMLMQLAFWLTSTNQSQRPLRFVFPAVPISLSSTCVQLSSSDLNLLAPRPLRIYFSILFVGPLSLTT